MDRSNRILNTEFAKVLVEEIVDTNQPDSRLFIDGCGIDSSNLDNSDEIWKTFVRYNLEVGGVKASTVYKYWNNTPEEALIKQREKLIEKTELLKNLECYNNFTNLCPITYKGKNFHNEDMCYDPDLFDECPVVNLIKDIKWHKLHYRIAKLLVEDTKRLLIEDYFGKRDGNLNHVVNGILAKYSDDINGNVTATQELLKKFDDMKGYGTPPKAIIWFLSELSSPVHQVNHWPKLDYTKLNPVDIHVKRLMFRFGFINSQEVSTEKISNMLLELYPEEPRKLDYALYRLGGDSEEDMCGKIPKCGLCKFKYPKVNKNCNAKDKLR